MTDRRTPDPAALQTRLLELETELATVQRLANDLRESEERLRILTEAASETIAILERGVVVDCNAQVGPMFGYEIADALGRPALDFIAPPSHEVAQRHIRAGYELPYEAMALRRDGTTFACIIRGKTTIFRGRPARVTIVRELHPRAAPLDPPALLTLAPDLALLPLTGAAALAAERARAALGDATTGVVLVDVSAVSDLAPQLDVLRGLNGGGARVVLTGAPGGPTLAEALREFMAAST